MAKSAFINSTIDKMVKKKFNTIYADAVEKANNTFDNEYLPKIKEHSFYAKIKYLQSRQQEVNEEGRKVKRT